MLQHFCCSTLGINDVSVSDLGRILVLVVRKDGIESVLMKDRIEPDAGVPIFAEEREHGDVHDRKGMRRPSESHYVRNLILFFY